ncbi:MAG: polysulfide reductase NrfD [SAR324 cluster bacterium]|nr:polysulfide reductase NrfD [SAR324 cluster bacterium]
MNYGFIIDNRKCIGCHACTVACKAEHDTPIGVNRTWVKYVEKGTYPNTRRLFTVHRCNHCADAPCVEICPVRSLYLREDGIVDFDRERCIGCKACMQACPYDALHIDPETHTASKCNYCAHRTDRGLEPACVIVCPVHAIISGDMDDAGSEIARTLSRHPVSVRKPEKNTRPKLFYIDADAAAIRPEMAPADPLYSQTEQTAGVGHFAPHGEGDGRGNGAESVAWLLKVLPYSADTIARAESKVQREAEQARRTYDIPQRGVLWDWEVSGYLWSKSVAAGMVFLPLLLQLTGLMTLRPRLELALAAFSLIFLMLTGLLLIKDLDQPGRCLYVLLRPQWRSWLVRGAYILTAFAATTSLWLLLLLLGVGGFPWLHALLVVLGLLTAVYTAFLLGQAKGRDLWQSPLLAVRMIVTSAMTGSAAVLLLGLLADHGVLQAPLIALEVAIVAHLLLVAIEFATPHVTVDTATALGLIARGPLRVPFWSSLALGHLLPLALLLVSGNGLMVLAACVLVLLFTLVGEHVWVRAPQLISLS